MSGRILIKSMVFFTACIMLCGCVERELTVNTEPQGALVELNDEEIGFSPVTVSFNWYGDYRVRISKKGYETLNTHKELERPSHDKFPMDLFAELFTDKSDKFNWNFELTPHQTVDRNELIETASKMREKTASKLEKLESNPDLAEMLGE